MGVWANAGAGKAGVLEGQLAAGGTCEGVGALWPSSGVLYLVAMKELLGLGGSLDCVDKTRALTAQLF